MTGNGPQDAAWETLARARLGANPRDFTVLMQLAAHLLRSGRQDESLVLLGRAAALNPGHAAPFTLKAIALFRGRFGPPPPARLLPMGQKAVSMRTLGGNGKFGNQLLQYGFLRLYAAAHGLAALAPDWIGRDLFALDDPFCGRALPSIDESQVDFFAALNGRGPVFADHDLTGFFCGPTRNWQEHADAFRALFHPAPQVEPIVRQALAALRGRGRTLVAAHIRRGDFGYGPFWIAPSAWYREWLDRIWPGLDAPVLYVASDDPAAVAEFARFGAVGAGDLGADLPGADFYLDHYLLSHADHLAISNSSFSFTAAMLNRTAQACVRPDPDLRSLVRFDPWNADVLLQPAAGEPSPEAQNAIARIGPAETVVHAGAFCAPWTRLIRQRHPRLRVFEMPGDEPAFARMPDGIDHLIIEDAAHCAAVLAAAAGHLRRGAIGTIHVTQGILDLETRQVLEQHGFRLDEKTPPDPGPLLAVRNPPK